MTAEQDKAQAQGSPQAQTRARERGQTLVEFAIAAPLVFLILIALFDVGRLVFINNELTEAAREGARWGAVQGRAAYVTTKNQAIMTEVESRIVVTPGATVDYSCEDMGGAGGNCGSGDLLIVDVSADVQPITPIIGSIIGPLTLRSTTKMTVH